VTLNLARHKNKLAAERTWVQDKIPPPRGRAALPLCPKFSGDAQRRPTEVGMIFALHRSQIAGFGVSWPCAAWRRI
jgi:hypothetical protein